MIKAYTQLHRIQIQVLHNQKDFIYTLLTNWFQSSGKVFCALDQTPTDSFSNDTIFLHFSRIGGHFGAFRSESAFWIQIRYYDIRLLYLSR